VVVIAFLEFAQSDSLLLTSPQFSIFPSAIRCGRWCRRCRPRWCPFTLHSSRVGLQRVVFQGLPAALINNVQPPHPTFPPPPPSPPPPMHHPTVSPPL
jgi:hypothetical protein